MEIESITPLCPRDGSELEIKGWRDSQYGVCTRCHGIRIERSSLERIARSGSRPPLTVPDATMDGVEIVEDTALCSCRGQPLMHRVTQDDLSLDVCPRCSAFWFDAGEIQCYLATHATPEAMSRAGARSRSSENESLASQVAGGVVEGVLEEIFSILGAFL